MKKLIPVNMIAWLEILIGVCTLIGSSYIRFGGIPGFPPKPLNVYIFVTLTAITAFILGIGVLNRRRWAIRLLIFFSGYIILTKLLIYSGLLTFSGSIFTILPVHIKDGISILYHSLVIIILTSYEETQG
ncbi:MAG: hypothetical protein GF409_07175 [Candidatus Omnitrophica bacterium]|nr:hypothetical protein [Candidatus Omnitrophota bacterium]